MKKELKIEVIKNYIEGLPNEFAKATVDSGRAVKASKRYWFQCEHSPVRLYRYFLRITGLKTFISVHLVRHGVFASHAVTSKRDDLRQDPNEVIGRDTPVTHCIETNAPELIFISRRRLCYKSHRETVGAWKRITRAIKKVEPDLYPYLVPECVYRGHICPEPQQCSIGLEKVISLYPDYPLNPLEKDENGKVIKPIRKKVCPTNSHRPSPKKGKES